MLAYIRFIFFLPLLLLLPAAADDTPLKIAVAADNPPFFYTDAEGRQNGFDVEITNALCRQMQVTCTLLPLPKKQLPAALADKKVDAALALPVSQYGEQLIMTQRYYKFGARFVRKKGTKGRVSYKGMAGKNVGVVKDTVFDTFLSEKFSGVNILYYATIDDAYAALADSKIEYVLAGRVAQFVRGQEENYEVTGPNYSTAKYFSDTAIAVNNTVLRDRFNAALETVRNNGVYKDISKRFFSFDIYGR